MNKQYLLILIVFSLILPSLSYAKEKLEFKRYEEVDRKYNEQVAKKRDEEIVYIKKLLRDSRFKNKNKAPFILRLAELYWEQARYQYDLELAKNNELYEKWKIRKIGPEPKGNHIKSRNLYTQSISTASKVIKMKTSRMNKVKALYFLGFNLIEIDRGKEGVKHLEKITTQYKDIKQYSNKASVKIADFYFDKNQPRKALPFYKTMLAYKDPELHSYLLYKIAWTYSKLGWGDKALEAFENVRSYIIKNKSGSRALRLLEEAEKDIVKTLTIFKKPKEARYYLVRTFGEKNLRKRLEYLAKLYLAKGLRHSAAKIYREVIDLDRMNPENLNLEIKIFDMFKKPLNLSFLKEHIFHLQKTYGKDSPWYKKYGRKEKSLIKIEEMTRISVTLTHEEAKKRIRSKKNKLPKDLVFEDTLEMYALYLNSFPEHENAYELRFLYAQILYELNKLKKAAIQYEALYKANSKGKHNKIIVLNMVSCYDQLREKSSKKYKGTKKYEISKIEQKFIKAANLYIDLYPKDRKTNDELKFKISTIHYNYNDFENALPLYTALIINSKNAKLKEASTYQVMSIYTRQNNLEELAKFCRKLISIPGLKKLTKKLNLGSVLQNSEFRKAVEFQENGKTKLAADRFYEFYKAFPKSKKYAKKALFNSLVLYRKVGDTKQVNYLNKIIIAKYPRDKVAVSSYKELAKNHYESIELEEAAKYYLALYKSGKIKNVNDQVSILYNIAKIYYLLAKYNLAEVYFLEIEKKYPRAPEAIEAVLMQAKIKEAKKLYRASIPLYKKYFIKGAVSLDDRAYYYSKFANWYKDILKDQDKAKEYYKMILKIPYKKLRTGKEYHAEAKFYMLEKYYQQFLKVKAVVKAQTIMKGLLTRYKKIVNLKQPKWGVAAYIRVGGIFDYFGDVIKNAPLPSEKELGGTPIEDYKVEINKVVIQNKEEAAEYYKTAIQEANEYEVISIYTKEAIAKLNIINGNGPKTFGKLPDRNFVVITDNTKKDAYYEKF